MAFPSTVKTNADLLSAANNASTTLSSGINDSVATIPVVSAAPFPTESVVSIGDEIVKYTGKTSNSLTGCTRGYDNTSAASHLAGVVVDGNLVAAHHNLLRDEIIAIETALSRNAVARFGRLGVGGAAPLGTLDVYSGSGDSNISLRTPGSAGGDQITMNFITKDTAEYLGVPGPKGWSIYVRGDAWSGGSDQNKFGLSYWDGSAWRSALEITPSCNLILYSIPAYASNAAAVSGGLPAGALYRNGDNLCMVHN